MHLLTFQDKYAINVLKENGIYECEYDIIPENQYNLYDKFIDKMKLSLNLPKDRDIIPIWCWVIPKDQELNKNYIDMLYNRFAPRCNNLTYLELEVPKEFIFISNFDLWNDYIFKILFEDKQNFTDEEINKLFEKQKGSILQATIPFISKDFVKSTKIFNDYLNKDYTQTDEWISSEKARRGEKKFEEDF